MIRKAAEDNKESHTGSTVDADVRFIRRYSYEKL